MIRILRPDYSILTSSEGQLVLKSNKIKGIEFPILQAEAVYLSLFDGKKDDEDIEKVAIKLFDDNIIKLKGIEKFLLPLEVSNKIFGERKYLYNPKQFLLHKYKTQGHKKIHALIPSSLTLMLTHRCTRRCIYCYSRPIYAKSVERKSMNFETIKRTLDEAFDLAIGGVLLTGGEPLMHPHIYDIIDYLGQHGIYVQVITKYPLDESRLAIINTHTLDLYLSIDTHVPMLANYLTNSSSFFNDMLQNIDMLNRLGIPFKATSVISSKTANDMLGTVRFLLDSGAQCVYTGHYTCDDEIKMIKPLAMDKNDAYTYDEQWIRCINENGLEHVVIHKERQENVCMDLKNVACEGLSKKITINYNGDYILCDKLYNIACGLENIYRQSLLDHWMSPAMNRLRYPERKLYSSTICYFCEKYDNCVAKNSCYAKSLEQYHAFYHPIREVENACCQK